MGQLSGKRIAILATNDFEDSELSKPMEMAKAEGADVTVISEEGGSIKGENGTIIEVDKEVSEADVSDYDGLIIPGGVKNPDTMRQNEKAVAFVKSFFDNKKPVASICRGPWLLVEADAVRGRKLTSWPSLTTDIKNAGGEWMDQEVVIDQGLITSRKPDDLDAFNDAIIKIFA